jgi:hypothetical protein
VSGFCYLKVFALCVTAGRADDQDANSTFVLDDRDICYKVAMRTVALFQLQTRLSQLFWRKRRTEEAKEFALEDAVGQHAEYLAF